MVLFIAMSAALARVLEFEGNPPEVEAAFEGMPEDIVVEILDGELFASPRPARPHTRAASRLGRRLGPFDDDDGHPGGWIILDEPEIHLGPAPDKIVADLAGWRRERMLDALGPEGAPAHYEVAPDWVCEVLSPRTERTDRTRKMRIYRREGVGHVWLINPVLQTLEVYKLENGRWTLLDTFAGGAIVRAEPFDAIDLPLSSLWAR